MGCKVEGEADGVVHGSARGNPRLREPFKSPKRKTVSGAASKGSFRDWRRRKRERFPGHHPSAVTRQSVDPLRVDCDPPKRPGDPPSSA